MKKILKGLDRELHEKFKEYGANALLWKRKCILMLVEIDDARIWEKKGFSCIQEYAGRIAGIGRDTVNDGLRILRKTAQMPNICGVIEKRGINIIKPIENLLTVENEKEWAEKAAVMGVQTLRTYVQDLRRDVPSKNPENTNQQAISIVGNATLERGNLHDQISSHTDLANAAKSTQQIPPKKLVAMQLDPQLLQKLEKLKGKSDWNELFAQLLEEREEQLEKEKPQAVKTENRTFLQKSCTT